ncbi:hypothetical protein DFH08DRAFT_1000561 [Mycena albidolilacea]|uniref:Uncharacterized protein n=1 Tax=Mycena albidolilacea TaxID=1033008 RepID=A0AAD7A470_9AGAR|nr:hypothetical protein DFH08DRAFT_1000561 [Mycena albidolilacea]
MNYGCGKGLRRRLRICGTADFGAEAETEPLHLFAGASVAKRTSFSTDPLVVVSFRKKVFWTLVMRHYLTPCSLRIALRPPATLDEAPISPYVTTSLISRLTYSWYTPMMILGFQRTLQASDLWRMRPEREAG